MHGSLGKKYFCRQGNHMPLTHQRHNTSRELLTHESLLLPTSQL